MDGKDNGRRTDIGQGAYQSSLGPLSSTQKEISGAQDGWMVRWSLLLNLRGEERLTHTTLTFLMSVSCVIDL